jgi:hypothetical protein
MDRCAEVMLNQVAAHLRGSTSVERVEFVLFNDAALQVFRRVLEGMA